MTKQFDDPRFGTVHITKRRGAKSLKLRVTSPREVRISIPLWSPYKAGLLFASSKSEWIIENQQKFNEKSWHDGQSIGKTSTLHLRSNAKQQNSRYINNELYIAVTGDTTRLTNDEKKYITNKVASVRKREAEHHLTRRINELSRETGLTFNALKFRVMKGRWGSCSQSKTITLNVALIDLPWPNIDYVLIHELSHTVHMNHSERFWSLVEQHAPNYKILKKQLREFQTT